MLGYLMRDSLLSYKDSVLSDEENVLPGEEAVLYDEKGGGSPDEEAI
jgi:hypothetical protein